VAASTHQCPVQALGPDGADPSLRERIRPRSPVGRADDIDCFLPLKCGRGAASKSSPKRAPNRFSQSRAIPTRPTRTSAGVALKSNSPSWIRRDCQMRVVQTRSDPPLAVGRFRFERWRQQNHRPEARPGSPVSRPCQDATWCPGYPERPAWLVGPAPLPHKPHRQAPHLAVDWRPRSGEGDFGGPVLGDSWRPGCGEVRRCHQHVAGPS
jgi:hypothetical protein